MDLGVREWMIIIGVLLIVAVVLDGYRRVRNERRGRIRVSLSRQARRAARVSERQEPVPEEPSLGPNPELPNGGARPASRRRGSVPVLMQPVGEPLDDETAGGYGSDSNHTDDYSAYDAPTHTRRHGGEPAFAADGDEAERPSAWDDEPFADERVDGEQEDERDWRQDFTADGSEPSDAHDDEPLFQDDRDALFGSELDDREEGTTPLAANADTAAEPPLAGGRSPQEVLVIYVISRNRQGFKGQDLLQILLACDVRYARSRIFYRYEEAKGQGPVQFGVASLTEEGTFDLDGMDGQTIPGVCFFITLPGPVRSLRAFDYMVETAQVLVKNLDGEMRDESRSVMTAQTLEHYRQRIRDFERKQLTFQL